jgi:hypothetical protein
LLSPPGQRGHDVLGGQLLAVVKLDPLPQLEGVAQAVGRDGRHPLGQHGDRPVLIVQRVEAFVEMVRQGLDQGGGGPVRVERRGLPQDPDPQDAPALLGVGVAERPDGEDDGEDRERDPAHHGVTSPARR